MTESVALYARVSTLHQEQDATIESQVAALEAYARQHDYRLSPECYFLDVPASGASLHRPALDQLRDRAAEGAFAAVLCLSPDRLARRLVHQWVLLDELQRAGVRVIFPDQPARTDGPQGELLLGIQGLFAEYERALITERLRRGKLHRIRVGQLVTPQPPYGYRYLPVSAPEGGRWERHPVEADVVRQIYHWYTDREALSLRAIVDRLNTAGALAPPRGRQWTYSTVQAILTQPAYTGRAYYNRTRVCPESVGQPRRSGRGYRCRPSRVARPEAEWIEFAVPSIVEGTTWQQAQERLGMNRQFATRNNTRHFYLLRGLLVCGKCGRTLVGRTEAGQVYYHCTNRGKNRSPDVTAHSCSIAGRIVEPLVWEGIRRLLQNPVLIADAWRHESEGGANPDEIDRLEARQRGLERQWIRVVDAFQEGLLDKSELGGRKERLDRERQAVAERLQQLRRQVQQERVKERMLQEFAGFCQQIEETLASPTPEVQQEVLRLLVDHVVVEAEAITVKHIIPTDDDCRLRPGRR